MSLSSIGYLLLLLTSFGAGAEFPARDTLSLDSEGNADAQQCLEGLRWTPDAFTVSIEAALPDHGDWLVRFPSPRPGAHPVNNRVAMEWYQARDEQGQVITAPAVIVIHESGSGMTAGRVIAKSLRAQGIHALMLQLPYYGVRRGDAQRPQGSQVIDTLRQGVADARRALDAVRVLPSIDTERISLQGTSLGGFVAATTAGLDDAYQHVFITLAGGDLRRVVMEGKRDAAKFRETLEAGGMTTNEIEATLKLVEPLRIAHRIDPNHAWMFTARYDTVVPPECSKALHDAIGLSPDHGLEMLADHYTGAIYIPLIAQRIRDIINGTETTLRLE